MMAATSMLHVRMDDETKAEGNAVLEAIGLSASDAVRLFYRRLIADQAFPLELKVPNKATRVAMAESRAILRHRRARFQRPDDLIAGLEASGGE
jgi:DNA-damage-inducible protein J